MTRHPEIRCGTSRKCGFTIVEMLVTVTILGIIAVIALPSLEGLIANQRVRNVASDLMVTLMFARSEAIKRNAQINVVPTGGNWSSGWTVQTTGGISLRAQDAPKGVTATGPAGNLVYQGNGRVVGNAAIQFTFRSPTVSTVSMRCLTIDPSGRPNIQMDKDADITNGCAA